MLHSLNSHCVHYCAALVISLRSAAVVSMYSLMGLNVKPVFWSTQTHSFLESGKLAEKGLSSGDVGILCWFSSYSFYLCLFLYDVTMCYWDACKKLLTLTKREHTAYTSSMWELSFGSFWRLLLYLPWNVCFLCFCSRGKRVGLTFLRFFVFVFFVWCPEGWWFPLGMGKVVN